MSQINTDIHTLLQTKDAINTLKKEQRRYYEEKVRKYLTLRKELIPLPTLPESVIDKARNDFDFFASTFLYTYDPRKPNPDEKVVPFILYPFQESASQTIIEHITKKRDLLIEKSRDMGATWLILGIYLWGFLFHKWHLKVGSRKDEAVDKYGDMDTLFERLRFMIRNLPAELRPFDERVHFREKLIRHPDGENAIVGEATTKSFSRSGRYTSILLDEFAFVEPEDSEAIWQACGDSTPCRIALSTPPMHMRGKFVNLRMSGAIDILTLHWTLHPFKDEEWYQNEKARRSKKEIAIELDIDYTSSSDDRLISLSEIKQGMMRVTDTDPATQRIISVDLARFGEDETVIKVGWKNQRGQVYVAHTYTLKHKKATEVLGFLNSIRVNTDTIIIDAIGMGESFSDFLDAMVGNTIPFVGSNKSNHPNMLNRRAEGYFTLIEMIKRGEIRDDDEKARQQLVMLWYDYTHTGKKVVVSKERLRAQGIKSPDHADALMMLAWGSRFLEVIKEDPLPEIWRQIKAEVSDFTKTQRWEELRDVDFEEIPI